MESDKYNLVYTNIFCNLYKYIWQFIQIHFAMYTNTLCNSFCREEELQNANLFTRNKCWSQLSPSFHTDVLVKSVKIFNSAEKGNFVFLMLLFVRDHCHCRYSHNFSSSVFPFIGGEGLGVGWSKACFNFFLNTIKLEDKSFS